MQLLALTAMEEPVSFNTICVADREDQGVVGHPLAEPLDETTSRGQYAAGWQGGEKVVGLLDEEGFSKDSTPRPSPPSRWRSTPAAGPVWPFYLRTGKRWAAG